MIEIIIVNSPTKKPASQKQIRRGLFHSCSSDVRFSSNNEWDSTHTRIGSQKIRMIMRCRLLYLQVVYLVDNLHLLHGPLLPDCWTKWIPVPSIDLLDWLIPCLKVSLSSNSIRRVTSIARCLKKTRRYFVKISLLRKSVPPTKPQPSQCIRWRPALLTIRIFVEPWEL